MDDNSKKELVLKIKNGDTTFKDVLHREDISGKDLGECLGRALLDVMHGPEARENANECTPDIRDKLLYFYYQALDYQEMTRVFLHVLHCPDCQEVYRNIMEEEERKKEESSKELLRRMDENPEEFMEEPDRVIYVDFESRKVFDTEEELAKDKKAREDNIPKGVPIKETLRFTGTTPKDYKSHGAQEINILQRGFPIPISNTATLMEEKDGRGQHTIRAVFEESQEPRPDKIVLSFYGGDDEIIKLKVGKDDSEQHYLELRGESKWTALYRFPEDSPQWEKARIEVFQSSAEE